jgi:hypothetical protein
VSTPRKPRVSNFSHTTFIAAWVTLCAAYFDTQVLFNLSIVKAVSNGNPFPTDRAGFFGMATKGFAITHSRCRCKLRGLMERLAAVYEYHPRCV